MFLVFININFSHRNNTRFLRPTRYLTATSEFYTTVSVALGEMHINWMYVTILTQPTYLQSFSWSQHENWFNTYIQYLIRVLTLETWMLYNLLTAILIWGLLARLSTINTNVLLSSIFFIADSVVSGYLIILNWSKLTITNRAIS